MQPSCRVEVELLLARCGRSWRTLTWCRVSFGLQLGSFLDHVANRLFAVSGLPDKAMEQFRALASAHGSMISRDALLDEIFQPVPGRRSV